MPYDVSKLRAQASRGLLPSQVVLGVLLLEGREVPQDCAEAFRWLSIAAERGAARAKYHLGAMYATGTGTPRDVQRARPLLEEAASRGEVLALIELARLEDGLGQIQDARKWYVLALEQEDRVNLPEHMEEARRFVTDHPR